MDETGIHNIGQQVMGFVERVLKNDDTAVDV